tara:strand:+ start:3384 stop:3641 length:258 start_codon:yes stop_codon:yes gene_type:complete
MEALTKTHKLTLLNDDKLSFEYIMACLIRHCDHSLTQAEQCAILAHNKGKCDIISGEFFEMLELKNKFDLLKINSELIEHASDLY